MVLNDSWPDLRAAPLESSRTVRDDGKLVRLLDNI